MVFGPWASGLKLRFSGDEKPSILRFTVRWSAGDMVQYFVDADFLEIYDGLEYESGLRYQIDIAGLPSYPDLNISQIFDPPIFGYIVKIVPEKCEGYIFQPCMKLAGYAMLG